jgi:hypothetical protein
MSETKPSDEQHTTEHSGIPPRASRRRGRLMQAVAIAAALAGVVLLAAACGAGSASTTAAPESQGGSNSTDNADAISYTQCMRAHGVPNFPDPNSQGKPFTAQSLQQAGVDPGSPRFQPANQACAHLLPAPTAAQREQQLMESLRYAVCMRAHGVPGFPDPNAQGNILLDPSIVNSPQFQSAAQTCHSVDPGLAVPSNTGKKLPGSGGES